LPRAKGAARGWPASTRRHWLSVTTPGLPPPQSSRAWPRGGRPPWGGYGFTLHLIVNDEGELLALHVPPGKGDDRRPVEPLAAGLGGQLFGARGDIAQAWHALLLGQGLAWLTKSRTNRQHRLVRLWDTWLLRQRTLMETMNDQVKTIRHIEHTRHRSVTECMVNLVAGLIAYSHRPTTPSLGLRRDPLVPMLVM
jgi:transposase